MRHQSLQIILMMAPHYMWIKPHLLLIAEALERTLQDDIQTVQLRAARCLDVVVHSINAHLLSQSNQNNAEFECDVEVALQFWTKIQDILTGKLQVLTLNSAIKSIFCDAYSDIGVHIYERLPVRIRDFGFGSCFAPKVDSFFLIILAFQTNTHNCIDVWTVAGR